MACFDFFPRFLLVHKWTINPHCETNERLFCVTRWFYFVTTHRLICTRNVSRNIYGYLVGFPRISIARVTISGTISSTLLISWTKPHPVPHQTGPTSFRLSQYHFFSSGDGANFLSERNSVNFSSVGFSRKDLPTIFGPQGKGESRSKIIDGTVEFPPSDVSIIFCLILSEEAHSGVAINRVPKFMRS